MTLIRGVIFDYGFTLSSGLYFNVQPCGVDDWQSILTELVFGNPAVVGPWMRGKIGLSEVAEIVSRSLPLDHGELLDTMRRGCARLDENQAVRNLAESLKAQGVPIALVTANFDVFSDIVVPAHGYDELFDVIVNSSDHGTTDKRLLWPIAFACMGDSIGYHNTLLIEDGEKEPYLFRQLGGMAIQYIDDQQLVEEIKRLHLAT